ncbi:hypothetical protein [Peptacetobacter sp. AB845]|uniref:hypothetical protein n=1 Tax=Peptacetobacter sp. AB845 TaxID=3388429 RepID=UPI0039C96B51
MSILVGAGLLAIAASAEKSSRIDRQTRKKLSKAYDKEFNAKNMIEEKQKQVDNALLRVANRKRGILSTSIKEFLEIYDKIIKINFIESDEIKKLNQSSLALQNISELKCSVSNAALPLSDKEIILKFALTGVGGLMIADSKRNLSIANSQMKISRVIEEQAQSISVILDYITDISGKIASLLSKLNILFNKSIKESKILINEKGINRKNYNKEDRDILMTCINIADAIKKIIDAPIIDENGEIKEETLKIISIGNEYLEKINNLK